MYNLIYKLVKKFRLILDQHKFDLTQGKYNLFLFWSSIILSITIVVGLYFRLRYGF